MRIELVGGPLDGRQWDEPVPPMGPAPMLRLPVVDVMTFGTPVKDTAPARYAEYRLLPADAGLSVARYEHVAPGTALPEAGETGAQDG
jgi:hypothetical protein